MVFRSHSTGKGQQGQGTPLAWDRGRYYRTKKSSDRSTEAEEQLRLAQEASQIAAWTIDSESGEVWFSTGYHELFGLDRNTTVTSELLADLIVPEDRERVLETFRSVSSGSVRVEFRIRRGNEIRWLLSLGRRVKREGKQSFAAVTLDITAQKEAEEELARQAAELARSNNDLQQFSSIASHDLQEPLRNMAICSELLNRSYRHLLDDNGKQLVDMISSGARAGQALTQALLSYARAVGPEAAPSTPVAMSEAFDQALANLKSIIQESGAVITRGELPAIKGSHSADSTVSEPRRERHQISKEDSTGDTRRMRQARRQLADLGNR